jgi:RNA polymerase sigma factor (TIGR02999 family)
MPAPTMAFVSKGRRRQGTIAQGDPGAAELLPLVYEDLRRVAAHKLAAEATDYTLQPAELVHEAWLRLTAGAEPRWANRAHFLASAAEAMRHVLVDRARRRIALKRGGGARRVSLDEVDIPQAMEDDERLLAVDEALEQLAALHRRQAELVRLRYFTGMSFEEAAAALGISVRTAKDWWASSRAWLAVTLRRSV